MRDGARPMNRRRRALAWIAVYVSAIAVIAAFHARVIPHPAGQLLGDAAGDMAIYHYPVLNWARSALASGGLPLWNPLIFCGYPQWAEGQMALVGPLAPLLMFPITTALNLWWVTLHVMTAAATVWWLSTLRLSPLTALLGGLSIALSSAFVMRITGGHPNIAGCYPWFFVMAGAWNRWWEGRGRKWIVLAAAAWSFVIWSCHVQTAYHLMLWWCVLMLCGCGLACSGAFWRWLRGMIFIMGTGALTCSALLLPNIKFAMLSARASLSIYESSTFDFPAENVLTLLFPGCYGLGLTQAAGWKSIAYFGRWYHAWESSLLINPLILGCLFLPWPRRHKHIMRGLIIATAVCLALALGRQTPIFQAAYHALPGISMFRCHGRFMTPILFGITALGCLCLDNFLRHGARTQRSWRRTALAGGFIFSLILVAILLWARMHPEGAAAAFLAQTAGAPLMGPSLELFPSIPAGSSLNYFHEIAALRERTEVFSRAMLGAVCGWLILLPLCYVLARAGRKRAYAAIVVVAASLSVTFISARESLSYWNPRLSALPDAIIEQTRILTASGRVLLFGAGDRNGWMNENIPAATGYAALLGRRQNTLLALAMNHPVDTAEYQGNAWELGPAARWLGISALYGADPSLTPGGSYQLAAQEGDHRVWKVSNAMPLAMWTEGALAASSYKEAVDMLANPAIMRGGRVILESERSVAAADAPMRPLPITRPGLAEIHVPANRMRNGWIVVLESFLPGWKAFAGNRRVPITPAQVAFQAVRIDEPCDVVRFSYQPASFRYGLFLTLMTTGFLIWLSMTRGAAGKWHRRLPLDGAIPGSPLHKKKRPAKRASGKHRRN